MSNTLTYKAGKLRLLRDFQIQLTEEQKRKLANLKTEIAIDNYVHRIIFETL